MAQTANTKLLLRLTTEIQSAKEMSSLVNCIGSYYRIEQVFGEWIEEEQNDAKFLCSITLSQIPEPRKTLKKKILSLFTSHDCKEHKEKFQQA